MSDRAIRSAIIGSFRGCRRWTFQVEMIVMCGWSKKGSEFFYVIDVCYSEQTVCRVPPLLCRRICEVKRGERKGG